MDLLNLSAPHGTEWELLVAAVVIIAGPTLMERIRVPGLIGLLAGGFLIGPNGLGIIGADGGIVKELGDVGLLYLMFLAGLELDLAVFAKFRKEAVSFSLLTFAAPMTLGLLGGLLVGYDLPAAILLGSLFASHTLVTYPVIRRYGLATNKAVATTVGATVLTDTLALVVLAMVSGSTTGSATGVELLAQVGLGIALLVGYCFVVLPRVARWFFAGLGRERTLRYVFMLAVLLSAGVLAEVVGIEAIVGAFFAGLAVNRLVPNEGEFMERIEFFGSALLVPMFLVSVGTVIDLAVLADRGTIGLAAVFVATCVGGKLLAAVACRPLFRFTWDEVGVVFSLSVSQAAATLAATFVGLEIGLLDTSAVNAIMLVIVVSLVVSSLTATRYGSRVPRPPTDGSRLGRSVVVQMGEMADAPATLGVAARLAEVDGGVVRPVVVVPDGLPAPDDEHVAALDGAVSALGIDADVDVRHDHTVSDGLLHAVASFHSSLVVVPAATEVWLPTLLGAAQHTLVAASPVPVVLVRHGSGPVGRVVLALASTQARRGQSATQLAVQLAARLHRSGLPLVVVAGADPYAGLLAPVADSTLVREAPAEWLAANGQAGDLVVLAGGRIGAVSTARASRQAASRGSSVAVVADATSVTVSEAAAQSLGLVTTTRLPPA